MRPALRVAAILVALAACAWFAWDAQQAHLVDRATTAVEGPRALTPARAGVVDGWLSSAATLNPDREVDILRARAEIDTGHIAAAQRILEAVTRAEPQNLEGWIWLAGASLGDPPAARRATARILRLDPWARRQL